MPAQTRRSNRTARAAELNEQQQQPKLSAVPNPEQPKPAPKSQPKPIATVDLGARPVTFWFPSAKLASGETVTCVHQKYGHESEASAKRCINALVASKGHRVA